MPRTSKKQPATAKKKQPAAAAKGKVVSHTDDGTPIVNATMAQIRKGQTGKSTQQLVRIPQVAERSKFYAEAAQVIGERESLALPYHGGRTWKCEVKVSDGNGAYGDNKGGRKGRKNDNDEDGEGAPKQKKTNYKSLTPLFRWYRGQLVLATLPYILEGVEEVDSKLPGKKRWANGMGEDEGLDSSDEEFDDDKYLIEPVTKMNMEISQLTESAFEDSNHPRPDIVRSWVSPDLQRFHSRKSAKEHAEALVKRDLLIDRTLYGYGHNGVRLRPVKPTRKQALDAGLARFVRDGLWVVGQEELWIAKRREVLVKKQKKRLLKEKMGCESHECGVCKSGENQDAMLECDKCSQGYHMACLNPPLQAVPKGDWFCDHCSQEMMVQEEAPPVVTEGSSEEQPAEGEKLESDAKLMANEEKESADRRVAAASLDTSAEEKKEDGDWMENAKVAAPHAATAASYIDSTTAGASSTNIQTELRRVVAVGTKFSMDSKLGLSLFQKQGESEMHVSKINPDSLFAGTELREGMKVDSINGRTFSKTAQCVEFLKAVVGQVVIVASTVAPPPVTTSNESIPVAASNDAKPAAASAEEKQDVVKLFDASAEGKERRSLNDKQTNSKRVMTEQDTADLAQLESQRALLTLARDEAKREKKSDEDIAAAAKAITDWDKCADGKKRKNLKTKKRHSQLTMTEEDLARLTELNTKRASFSKMTKEELASWKSQIQGAIAAAAAAAAAKREEAAKVSPTTIGSDDAKNGANNGEESEALVVKRAPGSRPPPEFKPSTHYRLNQSQIDQCFSACIDHYEKVMHTVKARSLHHELQDGFDVMRERGRGRYDMELDAFDTDAFSFLTDPRKAAWMPIVHKILGDDALLVHKGCFLSLPGSETQVYHQDGVHLNKKVHKPCYAINVFIPLVDMVMTNGPTEFCLGTHYLGHENFTKENVYTPCAAAGVPVIFDYRLGHRGLGNNSQAVRPVVYLTYSSMASGKEFRDSVNFSRKRYRKLGDFAEQGLSREERAKKRRMW